MALAKNISLICKIHCNLWLNQSWKTKGSICSFQKQKKDPTSVC